MLISPAELALALASSTPPRLLDVRWALTKPNGADEHAEGHLPGAAYVDLDTELADIGEPTRGRHPLPSRDALEASARAWGLNDGDAVVVYDAGHGFGAARAWWLLRHAGVDVRILDGGYAAWVLAGLPVETGAVAPEPGSIGLGWDGMPVIEADDAAAWPARGLLLDARAGERFRGEIEPMDPVAGHIPGAVNAPTSENVGAGGTFLAAAELEARFAQLGVDGRSEVAVYCGSGVTAAHQIAALEIAGFTAALYPGSWSAWAHQGRPVETGE
ncbi:sulfurtransferase [Demequina sp. SYSU T00192]|uniref:Sulfurtransferase n=1 Tax=Demequina litoralis TaxID=3051660 RepID=A0ABT8G9C8_9MICO|nr:sulfurtransferase [Demequina sp. SYSU T00192]MDN4475741.1 sulfurtransferase [Demequina sp. SYSU T00192]